MLVGHDDVVMILKTVHHVVGAEKGSLGGQTEVGGSHHLDVGPGDGQDERGAVRCRVDAAVGRGGGGEGGVRGLLEDRVAGEEGNQVFFAGGGGREGGAEWVL